MCNDETYLTADDFACIGQIAKHCDKPKLCIAIKEARDFDLEKLLCDALFVEVIANINSTDPFWINLFCGGTFESKCGKTKRHYGLKRIWVYFAYSRYILLNGYNDTPNGFVQKTNDFSIPTPIKELQVFENKYRNMGFDAWEKTKEFICVNSESFTVEIPFECGCECSCETCKGTTQNQTRTLRSYVVKKEVPNINNYNYDKFSDRYER